MRRVLSGAAIGLVAVLSACSDTSNQTLRVAPSSTSLASVTASAPQPSTSAATTTVGAAAGRLRALANPLDTARDPSAVWNGQLLYAWFGERAAAYNPNTDTWQFLPSSGLSPRADAVVAWTASMLVVWGGRDADGARYDPTAGTWRAIAPSPITSRARGESAAAASDHELFVWGGVNADGSVATDGAAYDPVSDRWRMLPAAPIAGRAFAAATWSNNELIVWGGTMSPTGNDGGRADGAAYNPATDTWRVLARSPLSAGITSGVWTGHEVLYGPTHSGNANGMLASSTAASYDPSTDTWQRIELGIGHPGFISAWDGERLLLFAKGGGIAVDPRTGRYTTIPGEQQVPTSAAIASTGAGAYLLGEGRLIEYAS